jgi:hypothetical protein
METKGTEIPTDTADAENNAVNPAVAEKAAIFLRPEPELALDPDEGLSEKEKAKIVCLLCCISAYVALWQIEHYISARTKLNECRIVPLYESLICDFCRGCLYSTLQRSLTVPISVTRN